MPKNISAATASRDHLRLEDGSSIFRTAEIPWTHLKVPGFDGIAYKILNYDRNRGYLVVLNTFAPGSRFAAHKHLGAVEIFMLSGSFFYENGMVHEGDYMLEVGGITHAPASDEGALMITIFHGPLQITGEDGTIQAVVDIDAMYGLAKANNAVAHLELLTPSE